MFNSLATGRFGSDFKKLIFNFVLLIGILRSLYDNALRWMPQSITDDKSTLVQVMAWCRQATSYYMSQCWPRSMSPSGVTMPQWVNPSPKNSRKVNSIHCLCLSVHLSHQFCLHDKSQGIPQVFFELNRRMARSRVSFIIDTAAHSLLLNMCKMAPKLIVWQFIHSWSHVSSWSHQILYEWNR